MTDEPMQFRKVNPADRVQYRRRRPRPKQLNPYRDLSDADLAAELRQRFALSALTVPAALVSEVCRRLEQR